MHAVVVQPSASVHLTQPSLPPVSFRSGTSSARIRNQTGGERQRCAQRERPSSPSEPLLRPRKHASGPAETKQAGHEKVQYRAAGRTACRPSLHRGRSACRPACPPRPSPRCRARPCSRGSLRRQRVRSARVSETQQTGNDQFAANRERGPHKASQQASASERQ